MSDDELRERIGEFDGIVIRSATKLTADLIERGRRGSRSSAAPAPASTTSTSRRPPSAGSSSPTRPESNSVAAAEHTIALVAGAVPQRPPGARLAASTASGSARSFGGIELYGKTLGVLGFGRIGQLVAKRAQAFEMEVVAFDKFVAAERFRELGVERAETSDELYARADIITIHLPKTPETVNWIDAEAFAQMKDGVRIVNCARGELVDLDALEDGLESGKVGGAALDVFPEEPFTDHPLFGLRRTWS